MKRTRGLHRKARKRVPYPVVALVGYTNAGKSTLFNALTKSGVLAKDLLFATLDPTMRALKLPSGRRVVLSRHGRDSSRTCQPNSSRHSAQRWKRFLRPKSSSMCATPPTTNRRLRKPT